MLSQVSHALCPPPESQLPDEDGEGLGGGEQLTHMGRSLDEMDEFGGRVRCSLDWLLTSLAARWVARLMVC